MALTRKLDSATLAGAQSAATPSMTYVGLRPCGCICACVVDSPEHAKDTAKTVAGYIKNGLSVERWTTEKVRGTSWRCPHKARHGGLDFGEAAGGDRDAE